MNSCNITLKVCSVHVRASLPRTKVECPCLEVCIPVIQPGTLPYRGEKCAPEILLEMCGVKRRAESTGESSFCQPRELLCGVQGPCAHPLFSPPAARTNPGEEDEMCRRMRGAKYRPNQRRAAAGCGAYSL